MAKKKRNKKAPTKITVKQQLKMQRKARRDAGEKLSPGTKVHKSDKTYTRKPKHNKPPSTEEEE